MNWSLKSLKLVIFRTRTAFELELLSNMNMNSNIEGAAIGSLFWTVRVRKRQFKFERDSSNSKEDPRVGPF